MKKTLLVLMTALALTPIAECGIGGIPGSFTFNSVGPGQPAQPSRESAHAAREREHLVTGGAELANRKSSAFRRPGSSSPDTTTLISHSTQR